MPAISSVAVPIVVDSDPGGDEAMAFLLGLASPEVDFGALTTAYGDQTLEKMTVNAL